MVLGETLKLIDFGSVKSLEMQEGLKSGRTLTATGDVIGTPAYMSPEQFDPKFAKISAATDIYCLGVTMYEMFTDRLPFSGSSMVEYGTAHMKSTPVRPRELNEEIPLWLDILIAKMLEKRPKERASLAMIRSTIEANRASSIEATMNQSRELMAELASKGLSDELEGELGKITGSLQSRLAGASQAMRLKMIEQIKNIELAVVKAEEEERRRDVQITAAFNPLQCPNQRCQTQLKPGVGVCPQCGVSWQIVCVCDKKLEIPYLREKCTKCRECRPIPLEYKQKHALLITVAACIKEEAYPEALGYLTARHFAAFSDDQQVAAQRQQVEKALADRRKVVSQKIVEDAQKVADSLVKETEEEKKRRVEDERKRQDQERAAELDKLEAMRMAGDLMPAFEYYRDTFPANLKNAESEAMREKICDELNAGDMQEAQALLAGQKYQQALQKLAQIPAEFLTTANKKMMAEINRWRELMQNIPNGFSYLQEASYTCGGMSNKIQEFRHDATGMEFVYIPGGSFMMGSPKGEKDRSDDKVQHKVTLSPYLIGKYPVTQAQWQKIMGSNPAKFTNAGSNAPMEQVSWDDCQAFCKKAGLQLPSEAQWEYACRAGSKGAYCFGDSESKLGDYAWYDKNSGNTTHPVGQKKPNAFGLYDVHGNVWEWCQDYYASYPDGEVTNPIVTNGLAYVRRGGSWNLVPRLCRSAFRHSFSSTTRCVFLGFRCARSLT